MIRAEKIEAIGDYLMAAEILRDGDGKVVVERPDFSSYYSNQYLSEAGASAQQAGLCANLGHVWIVLNIDAD